ncbi:MAG: hypothetical protein RR101_13295 [Burkholderiaceae bacterium]
MQTRENLLTVDDIEELFPKIEVLLDQAEAVFSAVAKGPLKVIEAARFLGNHEAAELFFCLIHDGQIDGLRLEDDCAVLAQAS